MFRYKCKSCGHRISEKEFKEITENEMLIQAEIDGDCPHCGEDGDVKIN